MYGQVTIRDTSPTEFDKLSLLRIPRRPQGLELQPESGDHAGAQNVIFGKWSCCRAYCSCIALFVVTKRYQSRKNPAHSAWASSRSIYKMRRQFQHFAYGVEECWA